MFNRKVLVGLPVVVMALVSLIGCDSGETSPEDRCRQNEVWLNNQCVQTCESDDNCSDMICLDGICAAGRRPTVSTMVPADGATGIAIDTEMVLSFSEAMTPEPAAGEIAVLEDETAISIELVENSDGFTLIPEQPLRQGVLYTVRVAETLQSALDVPMGVETAFSFTTVEALTVLGVTPENGDSNVALLPRIHVTFSRPVAEDSLSALVFTEVSGGPAIETNLFGTGDASHWVVVPAQVLSSATDYLITIGTEVVAEDGGVLEEDVLSWFTTGNIADDVAPAITVNDLSELLGPIHLSEAGKLDFGGTVSDAESTVVWMSAQLALGEVQWELGTLEEFGSGTYEFSWSPESAAQAIEGVAQLTVRAVDQAGNIGEVVTDIGVDFVAPDTPTELTELSSTWKFKTLHMAWQTESLGSVTLRAGDADEQVLLADESGVVSVVLEMPEEGASLLLEVVASDGVGNVSSQSWQHTITRVPYTCLHTSAGFPTPGVTTDVDAFTDDFEGMVTVRYRLEPDVAEDTVLHAQLMTQNFESTPYLSLRFFPRVMGLLRFDDSLLHPCATLASAKLGFYNRPVCTDCEMSETISFYGIQVSWVAAEATWQKAAATTPWNEPGLSTVDRDESSTATLIYETLDGVDVGNVDLTSLVQDWVSYLNSSDAGRPNHGIALFQDDVLGATFHSVDASEPDQVPYLELTWVEQR